MGRCLGRRPKRSRHKRCCGARIDRKHLALRGRFALALLVLAAILGGTTKLTREVAAGQTEGVLTVPSGLYPVAAVAFLEDQKLAGNLFCGFSWGSIVSGIYRPVASSFVTDATKQSIQQRSPLSRSAHSRHRPNDSRS